MCVDDYCFILIINSWKTVIFATMNALTLGFRFLQWVSGKGFSTALYYKAQTHNKRIRYKRTPHGPEARYMNAGHCHTTSANQSIKRMSKKCSDRSRQRPQPQGPMFRSRFECTERQVASVVAIIQRESDTDLLPPPLEEATLGYSQTERRRTATWLSPWLLGEATVGSSQTERRRTATWVNTDACSLYKRD